jgi:hypothetical protein
MNVKYRRNSRKPKTTRRYNKKRGMRNVPRMLTPKTFRFKRDIEQTLAFSGSVAPEGWTLDGSNRIYKNFGWSLGSLPNHEEFQALFKQYRLKGARIRLFFSNTVSGAEDANSHANSQLIVRMAPNQRGSNDALTQEYWQQIQAKKYKTAINGGKPLDIYMPLKQPNEMQTSTGTAPSLISPKFVMSSVSNLVHYGISMSIERADGQGFTTGYGNQQYCKIITTLYLETRGVF